MGMLITDLAELVSGQNEVTLSMHSVTISDLQYLQCFLHNAFEEVNSMA